MHQYATRNVLATATAMAGALGQMAAPGIAAAARHHFRETILFGDARGRFASRPPEAE